MDKSLIADRLESFNQTDQSECMVTVMQYNVSCFLKKRHYKRNWTLINFNSNNLRIEKIATIVLIGCIITKQRKRKNCEIYKKAWLNN